MIEIKNRSDKKRLRRIALASQGLLSASPFGHGLKGVRNTLNHLGYVQIDTISVIERAHHHVLHSRVPNFRPHMLNQLLENGDVFEYWSHAAAFLPIQDFRYSLPYKHALKSGQTHWYKNPDRKLMSEVLAKIRLDGPTRSRDLQSETEKRAGWWEWKPAKRALEQLYMEGDLMVTKREGFQKVYDLTERVLPSNLNSMMPSMEEFAAYLVEQQLRMYGIATSKNFTYLRKNADLRQAVRNLIDEQISAGLLEQVQLQNGELYYIKRGVFENPLPRVNKRVLILSPFDNCVIQRDRLKAIFDYQYQIECYLPEPKRQYGYFCLPILYGDEFVGRMDCKAHRKTKHFEIKSLFFEIGSTGIESTETNNLEKAKRELDAFYLAFVKAAQHFARFQGCDFISVTKVNSAHLKGLVGSIPIDE